jgi:hypothetical protein
MYTSVILCEDCRLTPAAAALLAEVVKDLKRARPDDLKWGADVCSTCGEVTGVFDDREGWAFGTRAPVPVAETERQPFVWVA